MNETARNTDELIEDVLTCAPSMWRMKVEQLSMEEARALDAALADQVERMTFLRSYISDRAGLAGCGDQGHESANSNAKRAVAGARKAMGFSYPKRGPLAERGIS